MHWNNTNMHDNIFPVTILYVIDNFVCQFKLVTQSCMIIQRDYNFTLQVITLLSVAMTPERREFYIKIHHMMRRVSLIISRLKFEKATAIQLELKIKVEIQLHIQIPIIFVLPVEQIVTYGSLYPLSICLSVPLSRFPFAGAKCIL